MGRILAPEDVRVIWNTFEKIAGAPWFEPADAGAFALYLLHSYSRGHDETSLKAIAEPFAREWFRVGLDRFDALSS